MRGRFLEIVQTLFYLFQALQEAEEKHAVALDQLVSKMEREKTLSLSQMQTSFTAEKQVRFNEALNKVCCIQSALFKNTLTGLFQFTSRD